MARPSGSVLGMPAASATARLSLLQGAGGPDKAWASASGASRRMDPGSASPAAGPPCRNTWCAFGMAKRNVPRKLRGPGSWRTTRAVGRDQLARAASTGSAAALKTCRPRASNCAGSRRASGATCASTRRGGSTRSGCTTRYRSSARNVSTDRVAAAKLAACESTSRLLSINRTRSPAGSISRKRPRTSDNSQRARSRLALSWLIRSSIGRFNAASVAGPTRPSALSWWRAWKRRTASASAGSKRAESSAIPGKSPVWTRRRLRMRTRGSSMPTSSTRPPGTDSQPPSSSSMTRYLASADLKRPYSGCTGRSSPSWGATALPIAILVTTVAAGSPRIVPSRSQRGCPVAASSLPKWRCAARRSNASVNRRSTVAAALALSGDCLRRSSAARIASKW
jgi:hypothetical protein